MTGETNIHGTGVGGLRSSIDHMRANPGKVHVLVLVGPNGEQIEEMVMPEDIDAVCEELDKIVVKNS